MKHIAPYLPYGLKAKLSQEGVFNLDSEYRNEYAYSICTITDFTTYSKDLGGSMKVDKTKDYSFDFDSLSEIEIILRPLSDLKKEIEHNGEKFVPYNELDKIKKDVEVYRPINFNSPIELLINTDDYSQEIDLYDGYLIIQKLLEWHFDIFGLIESGLAIDINTLNK